jgi:hypothetical protein
MINATELLMQDRFTDLWNRYCGFIELDTSLFMKIQEELLLEQLKLLHTSRLGKKFLGDVIPESVSEFRKIVPLTTYSDYLEILNKKDESALPAKPLFWAMTTGKPGEYNEKWAPYPYSFVLSNARAFLGAVIMSTAYDRSKFRFGYRKHFLYGMAPLPYITGTIPYGLKYEYEFDYLPPVESAEKMNFDQRNMVGFELGFEKGIDYFFGVASVLVKVGESFSNYIKTLKVSSLMKQPKKFLLLATAYLKSKILRRNMLPKDVWNLTGIICGGIDSALYADDIEYYWGKKPLELYGGTEIGIVAFQAWNRKGMTFVPYTNFLEFIPWEEHEKNREDPAYTPKTILFDELRAGELYEVVITSLNSGAFVRYRVGDIIRVVSNSDEEAKINLPQIRFENRTEDVIDIAGFTRLTERVIWQALINTGIKFKDWIAVKEITEEGKKPIVHIYAEVSDCSLDESFCENLIHNALKELDHDYRDYEEMIGKRPLKFTIVKGEAFSKLKNFIKANQKDKKEPSSIPHMNPPKFLFNKFMEIFREDSNGN